MSDPSRPPVATPRPHPGAIAARIRDLAKVSENVRWGPHARARLGLRDITDRMMFEVLRTGEIRGAVEPGSGPGEWTCKMVQTMKGRREIGVVTVLVRNEKLFVKTVEWEDL